MKRQRKKAVFTAFFLCLNCIVVGLRQRALDIPTAQAASADAHLLNAPVDDDVHGLDIRRPAALGLAIGMADQIAGHGSFRADFTELTHSVHLLAKTRTFKYYHTKLCNASVFFTVFPEFPVKFLPISFRRTNSV